jgi:hypothetical protein
MHYQFRFCYNVFIKNGTCNSIEVKISRDDTPVSLLQIS